MFRLYTVRYRKRKFSSRRTLPSGCLPATATPRPAARHSIPTSRNCDTLNWGIGVVRGLLPSNSEAAPTVCTPHDLLAFNTKHFSCDFSPGCHVPCDCYGTCLSFCSSLSTAKWLHQLALITDIFHVFYKAKQLGVIMFMCGCTQRAFLPQRVMRTREGNDRQ